MKLAFQFVVLGILSAACCSRLLAQETPVPEKGEAYVTALRKVLETSAQGYEFETAEEPPQSLKPQIVLRWTNNARSSVDGLTVIWVAPSGRPEAIAAFYPFDDKFCTEFDSLSRGTFRAKRQAQAFWSPAQAGLTFTRLEQGSVPAAAKATRLLQMKQIARQFDASMLGWSTKVNQREELRLLPTPIFHYEIENPQEILDGAVFAFTSGTDPEVVLVIEAVRDADQYAWEYAFARRTSGALEVRRDDRVVWDAGAYPDGGNPQGNHRGGQQPLAPLLAEQE